MNQPANTPDTPWPVGKVNDQVKGWIERLGYLWVEGQLTQINFKPTWKLSYLTLRDVQQEKSVQLTCPSSMLQSLSAPLKDGDRVIVHGKPAFYAYSRALRNCASSFRQRDFLILLASGHCLTYRTKSG